MASSVCWRGSAAREPPVKREKRWSSRASNSITGMTRRRAAANSMANGMPSSRRQIRPATEVVRSSPASAAPCCAARSVNSRTASELPIACAVSSSAGVSRDGTRWTYSPAMPSGSRLVASSTMFGQLRSRASASLAHASMTCSQLSSSTRRLCRPTASTSVSAAARPSSTGMPSTLATVTATSSGSCRGARSTNHTPSPEPSKSPAANWSASRVLPAPPEPVRVKRREAAIKRLTSLSSASRPMKLDAWTGRLFRSFGLSSDRSGGKAVASPSASSWKICPGRPRSFNRCSPRSVSDAPAGIESPTRAAVTAETRVCPPWPIAATRAAR